MRTVALCTIVALFAAGVGHANPQRCLTASRFGPNDEVGNLNHVTLEKTLAGAVQAIVNPIAIK